MGSALAARCGRRCTAPAPGRYRRPACRSAGTAAEWQAWQMPPCRSSLPARPRALIRPGAAVSWFPPRTRTCEVPRLFEAQHVGGQVLELLGGGLDGRHRALGDLAPRILAEGRQPIRIVILPL